MCCRPFRDWLPLSSPNNKGTGGVWFVHVQIKLSYLLQAIELPPTVCPPKPTQIKSKLKKTNSHQSFKSPHVRLQEVRTTTSNSMLDLFGPSSTTSFSSSISSSPYDVLKHSRSNLNFPTMTSTLFGNDGSENKNKSKDKDKDKDKDR